MIVEKNPDGHRLYYVRILAEHCLLLGRRVCLVLGKATESGAETQIHLRDLLNRVTVLETTDFSQGEVERLSRVVGATLTVIPDGDRFAIELGRAGSWAGSGEVSLLVMRERAQPQRLPGVQLAKTLLRSYFFARARRTSNVRLSLLKSATWAGTSKVRVALDPVTIHADEQDKMRVAKAWDMDSDLYWFGVLGVISVRKNLSFVADAVKRMGGTPVGLLVAGRVDEDARSALEYLIATLTTTGVQVRVVDGILEERDLDAAVGLLDCVVLAHSNEGPSGLLGKAAACGTRILAAGASSLRRDVAKYPESATWCELSIGPMSAAMRECRILPRPERVRDLGVTGFVESLL
ncbi:hypothetical protein [Cryobacterium sp. GrIS_2_6]|uniref:hypothetical protein n=1 Tax=Cryobacterium sp. GrIS_2_6 TaxID=3162785 RepID=UPI002E08E778|nr:hypothetical protein [Cryobacterium psychrotolerans]